MMVEQFGFYEYFTGGDKPQGLWLTDPLGYLEFLHLNMNAMMVITDSGGLQEETTVLGVPCITLRNNTERPITCECGTNFIVGNNRDNILHHTSKILNRKILWQRAGKMGRQGRRKDQCCVIALRPTNCLHF